jgi:hypothetical protein
MLKQTSWSHAKKTQTRTNSLSKRFHILRRCGPRLVDPGNGLFNTKDMSSHSRVQNKGMGTWINWHISPQSFCETGYPQFQKTIIIFPIQKGTAWGNFPTSKSIQIRITLLVKSLIPLCPWKNNILHSHIIITIQCEVCAAISPVAVKCHYL